MIGSCPLTVLPVLFLSVWYTCLFEYYRTTNGTARLTGLQLNVRFGVNVQYH